MYDIAFPTKDEATARTTPQTVRETGVSFASLKPNATIRMQLGRKAVSDE